VPVKIVFAADALPRNPTGKLMKRELKQFVAKRAGVSPE
jgi:acyl-coenzyme A synthetase/AMP-(fatty) acid ligase